MPATLTPSLRWITALLALLALIACGAPAAPPPTPDSHIRFQVYGDAEEREVYAAVVAGYTAAHPGRSVDLVYVPGQDDEPGQDDHTAKLQAAFTANDPPDVFMLNYRRQTQFAASGALAPVGPRLAGSGLNEAQFYPTALDAFRFGGQLQCLPQEISSLVVFYNKDLFAKYQVPLPHAGWNRQEFLQAAQRLTIDADRNGTPEIYGLSTEPIIMRLAPFIWQSGGELVDNPAAPTKLMLNDLVARKGLDFYLSLSNTYGVVPREEEAASENDYNRFIEGKLGMVLYSRRVVPAFRTITGFSWDVAPLPVDEKAATVLHSAGYCMAAVGKQHDAAWDFVRYAAGPEGQRIAAKLGRIVPSLKAVAESPDFLAKGQAPASARVFLDVIPAIRPLPSSPNWGAVEQTLNEALEQSFFANGEANEAAGGAEVESEGTTRPLSPAAKAIIAAALKRADQEAEEALARH